MRDRALFFRSLALICVGAVLGVGLSRFVPELIKAPEGDQKSWQELYGPMISSTLVATAGYLGIRYTASRSARQKQIELRVDRLTKRIDTIATLIGAMSTYVYCCFNLTKANDLVAIIEETYEEAESEESDEEISYDDLYKAQESESVALWKIQDASAEVTRLAHIFGALPYDAQFSMHLGDTVQRWLRFTSEAMNNESATLAGKMLAIYKSRDDLVDYLRKTIDALAIQRASLLGEEYIDFSRLDPPYFHKGSYTHELSIKLWEDDDDEWSRQVSV
ncbi:MAG: hypothetical protein EON58_07910 [Alphaproteobacteria bacterium]|nr:MAG: hypothetical protein EON58_07910 [Alphaproteobacteria bacterium]